MNIDDFKKAGVPWPGPDYVECTELLRKEGAIVSGTFKKKSGELHEGPFFYADKESGKGSWFIKPA